jgi:hypothetical protein
MVQRDFTSILRHSHQVLQETSAIVNNLHPSDGSSSSSSEALYHDSTADQLSIASSVMADSPPIERPHPKPQPVPTFDGTSDIDGFALAYAGYARLFGWTADYTIDALPFSLQGEARDQYYQEWGTDRPQTLEAAFEALRTFFGSTKREADDFEGLFSMRQKPGETVDEYARRFQKERANIRGPVTDPILKSTFIRGLSADLCAQVHDQNTRTFADSLAFARHSERGQQMRQQRSLEATIDNPKATEVAYPSPPAWHNPPRPPPNRNFQPTYGPLPPRPQGNSQPWRQSSPAARPPFQPNRPMPPLTNGQPDAEMIRLQEMMKGLSIGSAQYQQVQQEAMRQRRCLKCFSAAHFVRDCPQRLYPTNAALFENEEAYFEWARQAEHEANEWEESPSRAQ